MNLLGEFRVLTPKQLMEIAGKTAAAEQSIEEQLTGREVKKERLQTKMKDQIEALKKVGVKVAMANDPAANVSSMYTQMDNATSLPLLEGIPSGSQHAVDAGTVTSIEDVTTAEFWTDLNKKARVCAKMSDTGIDVQSFEREMKENKSVGVITCMFGGDQYNIEFRTDKASYEKAKYMIKGNGVFTDAKADSNTGIAVKHAFNAMRDIITRTDAFPLKLRFGDKIVTILNANDGKEMSILPSSSTHTEVDGSTTTGVSSGFGLQSAKTGSFILGPQGEFGDVIIDKDRLTIEKKLWAVNGDGEIVVDNETVSNGLQRLFISKLFPAKVIEPADIERFKELLILFNYVPSDATKRTVKYKKVFAETPADAKVLSTDLDVSRNILAIVAGNTGKVLINQTFKELDSQLKAGKIGVDKYNDYIMQLASSGRT